MGKQAGLVLCALLASACADNEAANPGVGGPEGAPAAPGGVGDSDPWARAAAGPSADVAVLADLGGLLFRAPIPTGNGRACATCHQPDKAFTISPAEIEERFQKNPKDPLFRSIDADDFANDFTTVRTKGLFRVTVPLLPNVRLADDPAATAVQVWRAVPTVQNVKLSAPFTHDGRAAALDEQARSAALEHSRPAKELPALAFDLIALFQERQFSSPALKKISALVDAGEPAPPQGQDYDAPLTPVEQKGFEVFTAHCASCHSGNARHVLDLSLAPTPAGTSFISAGVSELNRAGLPVRDFDVTTPDGAVVRISSPDPGRLLVTGNPLETNAFDPTQLRGLAKTAPYFHDNSAPDLRAVLDHYNFIFAFTGFPVVDPENFEPLIAYLQRL